MTGCRILCHNNKKAPTSNYKHTWNKQTKNPENLSKEIEDIKKKQMKTLEFSRHRMKNTITKKKYPQWMG